MLDALRRHPFPVEAHFEWSLVLAYAVPRALCEPLVPEGLVLDAYDDYGILAIAMVQTSKLRPKGLPSWMGRDFFLSGYRAFVRLERPNGALRGLKILRSDTDRRAMVALGNTFTHYGYRLAEVKASREGARMIVDVTTPAAEADLHVVVSLDGPELPAESPFSSLDEARKYAGPMPYTFDRDPSGKILSVRGLRKAWDQKPVRVLEQRSSFMARFPGARLANAFLVEDVPYSWKPGELV